MPGFDGSGPLGQGSMTGRAMGNCDGANQNVQGNVPLGRGLGRGMRGGRGFAGRGRGFYNNPSINQNANPNNQINDHLIAEKNAIEEKVKMLEEKIKALEENTDYNGGNMKVAVSTQGKDINSIVDARFGRTLGFIIYDTESDNWEYLDNSQVLNAPQGAGIQAAKHVIDAGANTVITGHLGPNAFKALSAAQVNAYTFKGGSVKEAIDSLKKGNLESLNNADVEGHWV